MSLAFSSRRLGGFFYVSSPASVEIDAGQIPQHTDRLGRIRVESEAGKGSTFHFTLRLPLAKDFHQESAAVAEIPTVAARALRILLAEDNPANQKLAAFILRDRGHGVDIAGDGRQALGMTQANPYDIILMDMQMPEMGGLEATRAIRAREAAQEGGPRHIPIIAMTACAMQADRETCLEAGMDAYLSKPIDGREMIALVERLACPAGSLAQPLEAAPIAAEAAAQAVAPQAAAVFDPAVALKRCYDRQDMVQEMTQCFFDDVDKLLPQMRAALEKGDLATVGKLGHRMRGTVAYLDADAAQEAALRVEQCGQANDGSPTEAEAAVKALEHECLLLQAALKEYSPAVDAIR